MRAAFATIAAIAVIVVGLYLLRDRPSQRPGLLAPLTRQAPAPMPRRAPSQPSEATNTTGIPATADVPATSGIPTTAGIPTTGEIPTTGNSPAPGEPAAVRASKSAQPAPVAAEATGTSEPPAAHKPTAAGKIVRREPTAAEATDTGGSPVTPESTAPPRVSKAVQREAKTFIAQLTEPTLEPIPVEKADHFVTASQKLELIPEASIAITTPAEIANDRTLAPNAPITVVREVEQIETLSPEQVLAEAGGNLDQTVRVIEGGGESTKTVRQILAIAARSTNKSVNVVQKVRYYEITTPAELAADAALGKDQSIGLIRKPYTLEAATLTQIMRNDPTVTPDSIFYVRTVRPSDRQGIWGIVFNGLIGNFARGIAIRRGERINTYQVEIPRDADERLKDRSSSYLGKLIYQKTLESYVYNYKENRMGHNPDRIWPGQEIVIIKFQPEELISIYNHFVSGQG